MDHNHIFSGKIFKTYRYSILTLLLVAAAIPVQAAGNYAPDEILVKYKNVLIDTPTGLVTPNARQITNAIGGRAISKIFRGKKGIVSKKLAGWRKVKLAAGVDPITAQKALLSNPNIEAVSLNYEISLFNVPDDPRLSEKWELINNRFYGGVDAISAWDTRTSTNGIVIAVLDSGIDFRHEDLFDNMWINPLETPPDGLDSDGNGCIDDIYGCNFSNATEFPSGLFYGMGSAHLDQNPNMYDDMGHGTHVAGIIGAVGNNAIGTTGIAWSTKLMAVRMIRRVSCNNCLGNVEHAAMAIEYAINQGANIINASWGFSQSILDSENISSILSDAFTLTTENNILVVAAAGNTSIGGTAIRDIDNPDSTGRIYPALFTHDNILVVANTDQNGLNKDSLYGNVSVDLGAPGTDILSTVPARDPIARTDMADPSGYAFATGTSMATPLVAGAAALVWAQEPTLTALQVKQRIMATVYPDASLKDTTVTGGRLNLISALDPSQPLPGEFSWLVAAVYLPLLLN